MRRQGGHRGHLRLGQRRQRGSRRCRPRPEVLSRRPPHGAVAGAAYGLLACWPVPSVRRVGRTSVGGTNRPPFLPSHSSAFGIAASGSPKRILSLTVRTLMTRVRHRPRPLAGAGPLWLSCQPPRRQRWRADRETPLSLRRGREWRRLFLLLTCGGATSRAYRCKNGWQAAWPIARHRYPLQAANATVTCNQNRHHRNSSPSANAAGSSSSSSGRSARSRSAARRRSRARSSRYWRQGSGMASSRSISRAWRPA